MAETKEIDGLSAARTPGSVRYSTQDGVPLTPAFCSTRGTTPAGPAEATLLRVDAEGLGAGDGGRGSDTSSVRSRPSMKTGEGAKPQAMMASLSEAGRDKGLAVAVQRGRGMIVRGRKEVWGMQAACCQG